MEIAKDFHPSQYRIRPVPCQSEDRVDKKKKMRGNIFFFLIKRRVITVLERRVTLERENRTGKIYILREYLKQSIWGSCVSFV